MQVEPDSRRVSELAGDNGRVEGGELVEAHHGRDLEAGAGAGHGGDEAYHQIGATVVIARDDEGRAPLVAGEIGEREAGKDDAAEGEHLAGPWRHQVGVGVEVRFTGEPVEGATGLGDGSHRQGVGVLAYDLDQHMYTGMGSDAAAGKLGGDLASLGIEGDFR